MLSIAVIGGGPHSRENHLPALARYADHSPGEIELAAFCDLDPVIAASIADEYGFKHLYTDVHEMLASEVLDGCIAITPIPVTARIASQVIEAGIPLLMEKPPGTTPQEARVIAELAARMTARVMVSMNRRFDPALNAAVNWRGDRKLDFIRAAMHRHSRSEPDFFTGTAIHSLDALRWLAGDIGDYSVHTQRVGGAWWYAVYLEFTSGARGMLDVMPTCGHHEESYEMLGDNYRLVVEAGDFGSAGFCAWEDGKIVQQAEPGRDDPPWIKNGTYAETVEFLSALRDKRLPHPAPSEVLQSVELCHRIQREAS